MYKEDIYTVHLLSNTVSTFKFFIFVECYAIMLSMFKNVLSVTYLYFRYISFEVRIVNFANVCEIILNSIHFSMYLYLEFTER